MLSIIFTTVAAFYPSPILCLDWYEKLVPAVDWAHNPVSTLETQRKKEKKTHKKRESVFGGLMAATVIKIRDHTELYFANCALNNDVTIREK